MDVVIVGGGVAGLSCAVRLGSTGNRITVLDRLAGPGDEIIAVPPSPLVP